jgi:hypothetical protein
MKTFSQKKTFVNKYDEIAKNFSTGVHPEMVDFVPRQGRPRGIALHPTGQAQRFLPEAQSRQGGTENAVSGQEMPFLDIPLRFDFISIIRLNK